VTLVALILLIALWHTEQRRKRVDWQYSRLRRVALGIPERVPTVREVQGARPATHVLERAHRPRAGARPRA